MKNASLNNSWTFFFFDEKDYKVLLLLFLEFPFPLVLKDYCLPDCILRYDDDTRRLHAHTHTCWPVWQQTKSLRHFTNGP